MDVDELVRAVRAALDDTERFAHSARQDFFTLEVLGIFAAYGDARHVLHHDPVAVLRQVAADRRVLERHQPRMLPAMPYRPAMAECEYCASLCHSRSGLGCDEPIDAPWPCLDFTDLADRLGIDLDWGADDA